MKQTAPAYVDVSAANVDLTSLIRRALRFAALISQATHYRRLTSASTEH